MKQLLKHCCDVRLRYQAARQFNFTDVIDEILSGDEYTAAYLRDPPVRYKSVTFKH